MVGNHFDIYQTEAGYVAVTNEVRRQILNALAKKDRQLPELVKLTKKAKPTLSSVHMKELLAQKLIEEIHHPTDKRKKIYRLKARRIGSSNLPVDQLRSAVKQYAALTPTASRLPLSAAFEALADAPPEADDAHLRRQARRLGTLGGELFEGGAPRETLTGFAAFLEREGLARALKIDLENLVLELEPHAALAPEAPEGRVAALLAGFVEGVAATKTPEARVEATSAGGRRFSLAFSLPASP